MLVVSFSSHGSCALTLVGDTNTTGARMPLKYTCVQPISVGRRSWLRSAEAVLKTRFDPRTETIVPGAIQAASPPPVSVEPLAAAVIWAVVVLEEAAIVTLRVMSLP